MKIGVLSNPLSRRNLKRSREVAEFLVQCEGVVHVELFDFASLGSVLSKFSASGVELLVVNAGDGTVSAVLTEIYEHRVFANPPIVAVLPGGTSNTIAGDVGLRGDRVKSLRRLLAVVEREEVEAHVAVRRLIRIQYDPDRPARWGMFFGTASICDAITLHRRMFPQRWIPDPLAGALTLARVLGGLVVGRSGVLISHRIGVDLDGNIEPATSYVVIIVTTLARIFLGSSPFWGVAEGGLKFTSIRSPVRGLIRHAYRFLYGRDKDQLPAATYHSASAERISLQMDGPFSLDGEFFKPAAGCAVVLTATAAARFVQC